MALYLIGLGLFDEKDITLRGLEFIKAADKVYMEYYTSLLQCDMRALEKLYGRKVIVADRELIEKGGENIVKEAKNYDVVILIIGDPMSATTHTQFLLDAHKQHVPVTIIHNASVLTAIGDTGLELYKFGKITSIVFPRKNQQVETYYDVIKQNRASGSHTLCLLDIAISSDVSDANFATQETAKQTKSNVARQQHRCMTVHEAINQLLAVEQQRKESVFTSDTLCVGCSRLGSPRQVIFAGAANVLLKKDFGDPPHCLIIPGKLHFVEEEALSLWNK
ncbi:diphthine synthase [Candidatus Woesearchaeota archaeon]|nr:diphthine synthase [Candidatus Woesearchaeota archaeon]